MFEWKISTCIPSAPAYSRILTSYSGRVRVPNTSVCTLPRMFMPAPWMTRTFMAEPRSEASPSGVSSKCSSCSALWSADRECLLLRAAQSRREGQKVAGLEIGPVGRLLVGEIVSVDVGAPISRCARPHHVEAVGRHHQQLARLGLQ